MVSKTIINLALIFNFKNKKTYRHKIISSPITYLTSTKIIFLQQQLPKA